LTGSVELDDSVTDCLGNASSARVRVRDAFSVPGMSPKSAIKALTRNLENIDKLKRDFETNHFNVLTIGCATELAITTNLLALVYYRIGRRSLARHIINACLSKTMIFCCAAENSQLLVNLVRIAVAEKSSSVGEEMFQAIYFLRDNEDELRSSVATEDLVSSLWKSTTVYHCQAHELIRLAILVLDFDASSDAARRSFALAQNWDGPESDLVQLAQAAEMQASARNKALNITRNAPRSHYSAIVANNIIDRAFP
jgi:hypothetical protein